MVKITIDQIKEKLKKQLAEKRYQHSLNVQSTAVRLAEKFRVSQEKASLAGLLHDCAKGLPGQQLLQVADRYKISVNEIEKIYPQLLHAPVGAIIAREQYGVVDREILQAISVHTFGQPAMSLLDKIIFLADMTEPGRVYPEVDELRTLAEKNLDQALFKALDYTIIYILDQKRLLHPQTILTRNYLLLNLLQSERNLDL